MVYNHYNETGLPMIEDSSFDGQFAFGHYGDPSKLFIKANINSIITTNLFDHAYNVINAINGHEGGHFSDWVKRAHGDHFQYVSLSVEERELIAIDYQRAHPSWNKTTESFKQKILMLQNHSNK